MVRLKVYIDSISLFHCCNFNSTMVRLKVPCFSRPRTQTKFQFHYGTIKSSISIKNSFSNSLFQFHYGTIKRSFTGKNLCHTSKFQFHYGTIKSCEYFMHEDAEG